MDLNIELNCESGACSEKELAPSIEENKPVFQWIYISTVIAATLMCTICIKWPSLANLCFYAACLETSLLGLKGTALDYVSPACLFLLASFVTLTLYCDSGAQLIFGLASFAINLFSILPVVYKVPLNM